MVTVYGHVGDAFSLLMWVIVSGRQNECLPTNTTAQMFRLIIVYGFKRYKPTMSEKYISDFVRSCQLNLGAGTPCFQLCGFKTVMSKMTNQTLGDMAVINGYVQFVRDKGNTMNFLT